MSTILQASTLFETVRNTVSRLVLHYGSPPFVFSQLPNELVHEIFRLAATSSPETASALCGVSSWARALAIPHCLPIVIIETVEALDHFMNYPTMSPSASWAHPLFFTRHLWITSLITYLSGRDPKTFMPKIMERSPNITSLALSGDCFLSLVESRRDTMWARNEDNLDVKILPGAGNTERDRRLFQSGSMAHNYTHPILRRVTRLTIHNLRDPKRDHLDLRLFPRLQWFAVTYHGSSAEFVHTLVRGPLSLSSLRMMVVLCGYCHIEPVFAEIFGKYNRVYVLRPHESSTGSPDEWEVERRGGDDVWMRARALMHELLINKANHIR